MDQRRHGLKYDYPGFYRPPVRPERGRVAEDPTVSIIGATVDT